MLSGVHEGVTDLQMKKTNMQKSINSGSVIITDDIHFVLVEIISNILELLENASKVSKDLSGL